MSVAGTFRRPFGRLGIDALLAILFRRLAEFLARHGFRIAAQQNVGAAARHVGGNGDGTHAAGLRHNQRFALVLLGIQHVVLHFLHVHHFGHAPGRAAQRNQAS